MRDIDAVLFDHGGVLTGPVKHLIARWLTTDGIDPKSFAATLRAWLSRDAEDGAPIHRLETGEATIAEFEVLFAAKLRPTDGRPVVADGILGRTFAGLQPEPAMFALPQELRTRGLKVGLLSNLWGNVYPRVRIDTLLDQAVISGEAGLRKPHAVISELALGRLGVPADRVLFIDDAEPSVLGARAAGPQALQHVAPRRPESPLAGLVLCLAH